MPRLLAELCFRSPSIPPRAARAAAAVVDPVPPCAIESAVVKPPIEVMSEFAPDLAASMFVRAPVEVVDPVPP